MKFRGLDANHDWTFGKGLNNYLDREKSIGVNVSTRIYSWVNDCFFDLLAGIDWVNRLGSKNQKNLLDRDLNRIILQSYGVTGIISFDSELIGREYRAHFTIQTIYSKAYTDSIKIGV